MATRRRRAWTRAAVVVTLVVVSIAVSITVYLERTLVAPVDRIEGVFTDLPDRPPMPRARPGRKPVNILFLGTDRRSTAQTTGARAAGRAWEPGAQRTDAMLVVHIDGDRDGMSVISLPRDSWVEIPGHGSAKINAAFSYGGPRLAVATVERLTRVRIDHLAIIDWEGLRQLTDALGGVTVDVPETVHDSARGITWTAGPHTLDGQDALDYVGQRYGLPGGDLDRARRQQNFLRLVLADTLERISGGGPLEVFRLLRVVADNVSVDAGWSTDDMARLGWSLRDLDATRTRFLTTPVAEFGWEGAQSVVRLHDRRGRALWKAVRDDQVADWADHNPDVELTDDVR
ncbi:MULTISPECIES: LCP family protein [Nocardioides]|uniref:LCP family protein n=1 Tax=Nocardioides vastitatis TaxID=2568655 RepID=A0ABW0ZGU8_9ACTN|nr:LCP family protein [Nocardioides sp.]